MPESTTSLSRDERYESLAFSYQQQLASLLNTALEEHGVDDAETRRQISAAFLFRLGALHDQQAVETDAETAYPLLCFSQRFLDVDTDVNDLGTVFAPSPSFSFLEHAHGAVAEALGEFTTPAGDIAGRDLQEITGWLRSPCSADEARQYCSDRDARGDICRSPGTWLGLLQVELLDALQPGDELWWYKADNRAWEEQRGSLGIALVRDRKAVAYIQTGRS